MTSTAVGMKRLMKLADLLEADASNKKGVRFDLGTVADPWDKVLVEEDANGGWPYSTYKTQPGYTPAANCGTVACAMGLAAVSGVFKRSGLTYEIEGTNIDIVLDGAIRAYEHAAMDFFALTEAEANWLFTPDFYTNKHGEYVEVKGAKGERRVAKRIRTLIAGNADINDYTV